MMKRAPKHPDLVSEVRAAVQEGRYAFSHHARARLLERDIARPEVRQVLLTGFHEKAKDSYNTLFNSWDYAFRGRTVERRELRVIIAMEDGLVIITVIDIKDRGKHED
jgi:hypothetical protein